MNSITVICLLALLPACAGITCYQCTAGSSGCDPFSSTGSGVTPLTSQAVCYKVTASGSLTYRGGYTVSSSCSSSNAFGYGTYCCSTDYCNGAISNYQSPLLMGLVAAALFAKYQLA